MKRIILDILPKVIDPKKIDAHEIVPDLFIKIGKNEIVNIYIGGISNIDINKKVRSVIIENLSGLDWDIKNINEMSQDEIKEYDNAIKDIHKQLLKY